MVPTANIEKEEMAKAITKIPCNMIFIKRFVILNLYSIPITGYRIKIKEKRGTTLHYETLVRIASAIDFRNVFDSTPKLTYFVSQLIN